MIKLINENLFFLTKTIIIIITLIVFCAMYLTIEETRSH